MIWSYILIITRKIKKDKHPQTNKMVQHISFWNGNLFPITNLLENRNKVESNGNANQNVLDE